LEAAFLELDNGACERAFKPVALGRKNWLFAGSDKGGRTAAILMSLCTSCKDLGIDPQAYLRDVLDRMSTHPAKRIDELLPDRSEEPRRTDAPEPRVCRHHGQARRDDARRASGSSRPASASAPVEPGAIESASPVTTSRRCPEHHPAPISYSEDAVHRMRAHYSFPAFFDLEP
jgi:hypothetical protein